MGSRALLNDIARNESVVRGLGDPEARLLVEWLVERAELLLLELPEESATPAIHQLCRRARGISRFVALWCHQRAWGAAGQLAVTERFTWPLPSTLLDPCDLMQQILAWEENEPPPLSRAG
jgi:hypothetical protein